MATPLEIPVQLDGCDVVVNSSGDGTLRINVHALDLDGQPAPDCTLLATPEQADDLIKALSRCRDAAAS